MYPHSCNNLHNSTPSHCTFEQPSPNRFVYVNQNFISPVPSTSAGVTKVLINPNFRQTVHINPNFKVPATPVKPKIHVNPELFKINKQDTYGNSATKVKANDVTVRSRPIVSTRTKLIRVINPSKTQIKRAAKELETRKRRKSLHTTYKIIRSTRCENSKAEANVRKLYHLKAKSKVEKTSNCKSFVVKSRYRLLNKAATSLITKNVFVKDKNCLNRSKYLSINGILYKKTPNVLEKANLTRARTAAIPKPDKKAKVLVIHGQIYKLDSNQRTLTLIPAKDNASNKFNMKRIDIGGVTFKQKEPNVYIKSDINRKRLLVSQARNKSIKILYNKMKKCNLPCPIYRKFGKCSRKDNGTCIRVHNPDQVALCTRFLQGACLDENCLLSHKVSPEKMPTCKYFLEGLCSRETCPYLHVKISPKAEICRDFLQGYCASAEKCDKRHQFLCPDFEKTATCARKRCPYPHGKVVRKFKVRDKVVKKVAENETKVSAAGGNAVEQNNDVNLRYYVGNVGVKFEERGDLFPDESDSSVDGGRSDVFSVSSDDGSVSKRFIKSRPNVGALPSFIPLGESDRV